MLKSANYLVRAAGIIIITIIDSCGLIFSLLFRRKKYNFYCHYRAWSKRVLWISGVKVQVSGGESLDLNQSYIYISNHSSLYDIPIIFSALDDDVRIMYKKELEKVPVFGYGLKLSPFISVIRTEPREAMKSIEHALEAIKENVSVIIFPEGTRSKDGKLAKFKRGAFLLASRSGKRIVPVAIIGSNKIKETSKWRFGNRNVKVVILEPVEALSEHDKMAEERQMAEVWDKINNALKSSE